MKIEKVYKVNIGDRPEGISNKDWNNLLNIIKEGDEVWYMSTDNQSWMMFMGSAGFGLIRDDKIIHYIETVMN